MDSDENPGHRDRRDLHARSSSQVEEELEQVKHGHVAKSSPQTGTKRNHTTDDESDSDNEVHISKNPKIEKKSTRPKASDFDNSERELVLAAANIYRILLASKGPFPNTATEIKLIRKAWKVMNAESGLKGRALTPSIITIVCFFKYIRVYYSKLSNLYLDKSSRLSASG